MKIFVYGTLKRAFNNEFARFLHSNASFFGEATVKGKLYLMDWYPGLILSGDGYDVYGEVFEIEHNIKEVSEMLDDYEGVAEGLYKKVEASVLVNNETVNMSLYESLHISDVEIRSGVFKAIDN